MTPGPDPGFLSTKEAAAYLNVSTQFLELWRARRVGPPYSKLDPHRQGKILYKRTDLDDFMRSKLVLPAGR